MNLNLLIFSFYKVLKAVGVYSARLLMVGTAGMFLGLYTPLGVTSPEGILFMFVGGIIWVISPLIDLFFGVRQ